MRVLLVPKLGKSRNGIIPSKPKALGGSNGPSCPTCGKLGSDVVDSRPIRGNVRRRRRCLSCDNRFTTFEIVALEPGGDYQI